MTSLKHMVRDWLITGLAATGAVDRYQGKQRSAGPLVRVLVLHDVPDRAWFASVLDLLQAEYALVTPAQFYARDVSAERINVLLTFDDGYQSWRDVVLPELAARDAQGLFFVSSGLLDAADAGGDAAAAFVRDRLRLTRDRRLLGWDGAQALLAAGQTLGGHTCTHARLADCAPAELAPEIVGDKAALEGRLGVTLTDFAYPFGRASDYTRAVTAAVTAAGYQRAYTGTTGFCPPATDPLVIPRTMLETTHSTTSLRHWIEGGYDILSTVVSRYE